MAWRDRRPGSGELDHDEGGGVYSACMNRNVHAGALCAEKGRRVEGWRSEVQGEVEVTSLEGDWYHDPLSK